MRCRYSRNFKLATLAMGTGLMVASLPASAQVSSLLGGQSTDEKVAEPEAVGQSETAANSSEEAQTSENSDGSAADAQTAAVADEGAESFGTLCGNGQGKPVEGEVRKKRKGLFGFADTVAAATRKIPLIGDFMVDSANSLSQSISCRLYPEEQKQAVEATNEATRGGEIGKTVEWTSTVRENVTGSSTVSAKNNLADGTPCMIVADIVIIEGEETRVSKKMCKLPGAARYTIVTA